MTAYFMGDYCPPIPPIPTPTTRAEAEAWLFQFAVRHGGGDPFALMQASRRFTINKRPGMLIDIVTGSGMQWYDQEWREFWWVYSQFFPTDPWT